MGSGASWQVEGKPPQKKKTRNTSQRENTKLCKYKHRKKGQLRKIAKGINLIANMTAKRSKLKGSAQTYTNKRNIMLSR